MTSPRYDYRSVVQETSTIRLTPNQFSELLRLTAKVRLYRNLRASALSPLIVSTAMLNVSNSWVLFAELVLSVTALVFVYLKRIQHQHRLDQLKLLIRAEEVRLNEFLNDD